MRKKGEVERAYPLVQGYITNFIKDKIPLTTPTLQQAFYKENYNSDSQLQNEIIYGCIMRGRSIAIKMLNEYLVSDEYQKDMKYTETYEANLCEEQVKSDDFAEFHNKLFTKKFGDKTKEIMKLYPYAPILAVIWMKKLREYSQNGNNFLIATYGNKSSWFIPSFWMWNIRDFDLYKRTLQILASQLQRGKDTKVMLPSGVPLEKVLEYQTVVRASLEDGTVWQCSNCKTRNLADKTHCMICGTCRN